jgi:hypothetical protein
MNMRRLAMRRPNFALGAGAVLLAAFLVGVVASLVHSGATSRAATPVQPQVIRDAAGDYVNFDLPYGSSLRLNSLRQAQSMLSFVPVAPVSLGKPLGIFTAADLSDRATKTIAIVYQHSQFGRFMIIEGPRIGSQSDLEALVTECNGPNPCDADWHLSTMADGTVGVMHVGSPTSAHATVGLMWFHGDRSFDLEGPASSFAASAASTLGDAIESVARVQ